MLPKPILDALVSVRHVECGEDMTVSDEDRGALPGFHKKWLVNALYEDFNDASSVGDIDTFDGKYVVDDTLSPSISILSNEAISHLSKNSNDSPYHEIVIAGEGEPTLRMDAVLSISHQIQLHRKSQNESQLPIRLITNGLVYTIPNFGYSPYNLHRNGRIPLHRHIILRDMLEAGITRVSVALNTANRHEYDILMEPTCFTTGNTLLGTAHDMVCEFIIEAAKVGIEVEITGIDRPDVDKNETDRLARMLLSVAERNKRSQVRWRKYFQ